MTETQNAFIVKKESHKQKGAVIFLAKIIGGELWKSLPTGVENCVLSEQQSVVVHLYEGGSKVSSATCNNICRVSENCKIYEEKK
jgi:hypothetical protein